MWDKVIWLKFHYHSKLLFFGIIKLCVTHTCRWTLQSWNDACCAVNCYLKTWASVDYMHVFTQHLIESGHWTQNPRHKDVFPRKQFLSQAYHGVLYSRSPLLHSLVDHCIDKLHKFSLCTVYYHISTCHVNCGHVFSRGHGHENCARVSRPFLPYVGDAIHPALQK